ncbi:MAG: Uma2 family endonuclease [Blastocatellia bacterium]
MPTMIQTDPARASYPQTDPPRPAREYLPTMYDLPSEEIGDAGMPDEFHVRQVMLLDETFIPPAVSPDEVFSAIDMNLYYDLRRTDWYKRPDWFAVIGAPRLYEGRDSRLSYVVWQEPVAPLIIVELLSPKTEKEDLGQTLREVNQPPTKWEVYERILRVPYYVVFGRKADELRVFKSSAMKYDEVVGHDGRVWIPEADLGLGLWLGSYRGDERLWLRWYDAQDNWIPTRDERVEQERRIAEQERSEKEAALLREARSFQRAEQAEQRAEQERQRAEQERQRAERLAELLRQMGKDPDQL